MTKLSVLESKMISDFFSLFYYSHATLFFVQNIIKTMSGTLGAYYDKKNFEK